MSDKKIPDYQDDQPVTPKERLFQLQQFGRRAGWDDPAMDIYDDLDPRKIRKPPADNSELK